MVMSTFPPRDIMRRTMANLKFVQAHSRNAGPFEVTQLVNSFLGALAHPWEQLDSEINKIPIQRAAANGWPEIRKEHQSDKDVASLGDLVRLIRNSFAHGNVQFIPGKNNEIAALRIWNEDNGRRTWSAKLSIHDLEQFLYAFVELAERLFEKQERLRARSA